MVELNLLEGGIFRFPIKEKATRRDRVCTHVVRKYNEMTTRKTLLNNMLSFGRSI